MNLLLALFRYFPGRGLQNDTLRFAQEAVRRGHHVTIFCTAWEGERPQGMEVVVRPVRAWTNHGAMVRFARLVADYRLSHPVHVSLAMDRIPGCDAYFVADSCMAAYLPRSHSPAVLACLPRYRAILRQEALVCSPHAHTRLLYIAQPQLDDYRRLYRMPPDRFSYLPPGMDGRCRLPRDNAVRQALRARLGLDEDTIALILVGTNLRRKGVDRALRALSSLPAHIKAHFFLAGMDHPAKVAKLAARTGAGKARFTFLEGRKDVPDLLHAMDLMLHPAREEGTGTVLVEAIASGLPVICSGACGFASFVQAATGTVLPEPFRQQDLDDLLAQSIRRLPALQDKTRRFAATQDFTTRSRVAVETLEKLAESRGEFDLGVLCPAPSVPPAAPPPRELTDACRRGRPIGRLSTAFPWSSWTRFPPFMTRTSGRGGSSWTPPRFASAESPCAEKFCWSENIAATGAPPGSAPPGGRGTPISPSGASPCPAWPLPGRQTGAFLSSPTPDTRA